MESPCQFHKSFHSQKRYWLFLVVVVAATYLLSQSLLLPYGNALRSLLPDDRIPVHDQIDHPIFRSLTKSVIVRNPLTVNASDLADDSDFNEFVEDGENFDDGNTDDNVEQMEKAEDNSIDLVTNRESHNGSTTENLEDLKDTFVSDFVENGENSSAIELATEAKHGLQLEQPVKSNLIVLTDNASINDAGHKPRKSGDVKTTSPMVTPSTNITYMKPMVSKASLSVSSVVLQNDHATTINISAMVDMIGEKRNRYELPPEKVTSINEMNSYLLQHRQSSRSTKPRWSSACDKDILAARMEIENAPIAVNDQELYASGFRNVSMFKRSYELMERTLKVYVYRDGKKPIFHQPILKGLYASEGWFMKLMERNKQFVVKNPRKAHLFYMPFSSRMLMYTLYVRNSHDRTNIFNYMKDYTEKIAAKYPYFNRTGGADHFLVACHDWAPYETRHHMEHCIKALCNSDVMEGFKIGRDVSLPETYIRSARNPLRDVGGKPPSQRHILAFYAGNMHGYLRQILLHFWKGKDPDMKIFGSMPRGVASKMNYIHHMKSSKYCICPKGFEVNSPRVVEAIFYECVPVIISDNFVPPFFEVLNWEAFSLIVAEKDIPNLKNILLSIPQEKYIQMQLAVRKIQKHFLWHAKPERYDLFHMTLHSIWYNRVYQIKT